MTPIDIETHIQKKKNKNGVRFVGRDRDHPGTFDSISFRIGSRPFVFPFVGGSVDGSRGNVTSCPLFNLRMKRDGNPRPCCVNGRERSRAIPREVDKERSSSITCSVCKNFTRVDPGVDPDLQPTEGSKGVAQMIDAKRIHLCVPTGSMPCTRSSRKSNRSTFEISSMKQNLLLSSFPYHGSFHEQNTRSYPKEQVRRIHNRGSQRVESMDPKGLIMKKERVGMEGSRIDCLG